MTANANNLSARILIAVEDVQLGDVILIDGYWKKVVGHATVPIGILITYGYGDKVCYYHGDQVELQSI